MDSDLLSRKRQDKDKRKGSKPTEPRYIRGRCLEQFARSAAKTLKSRKAPASEAGLLVYELESAAYALILRSAAALEANGELREFDQDRCLSEAIRAIEANEGECMARCGDAARRLAFMDPSQISGIRKRLQTDLTKRFALKKFRFKGKWLVKVASHRAAGFSQPHCSCCVEAVNGDGSKPVYFHPCLEASIILSDCFDYGSDAQVFSHKRHFLELCLASTIMEDACDTQRYSKAFGSLAKDMACWHASQPICILAGPGLATDAVMDICRKNGWDFLLLMDDDPSCELNMKFEDRISIGQANERRERIKTEIPLKGMRKVTVRRIWANGIEHYGSKVSMSRLSAEEGGETSIDLQWISSMPLNENDAFKLNEYPGFDTYLEPEYEADYNNMLTYNAKLDLSAAQNLLILDQLADFYLRLDAAKLSYLNPFQTLKSAARRLAEVMATL